MPSLGLNHVALTVSDRERSALFYATHFGFTQRVHCDGHLLILSDTHGGLLALSEGKVSELAWERTTHFGCRFESVEAVSELRASMKAVGVPEAEWQESGPTRIQVFDPDGYRIEAYAF